MASDETSGQGNTVSAVVAARLITITPQRLRQLVNEGFIPAPKARDAYSLVGVVQGYIKYLRDEDRRTSKSASSSRVSDRRADEIEMRIEEKSRALVNEAVAEALAIVDEYAGGLRSDMLSIAARVTNDIPLRRKIETEVNDAFGAAAKRAAASAASAQSPGDAVDPTGKPAARRVGARKPRVSKKRGRPRAP